MDDSGPKATVEPDAWPLRCAASPALNAAAFCTVCGQPFSGRYLGVAGDGRAVCFACVRRDGLAITLASPTVGGDPVLVDGWFSALRRILTQPHRTFAATYRVPLLPAVTFGYVFTLLGFAATNAWDLMLFGDEFVQSLVDGWDAVGVTLEPARANAALWLCLPIAAAIRMGVGSALLHIGIRLTVGPAAQLRESVRLFSLTSATLALCVIPTVGSFLALVTWISACMACLQTRQGLRTFAALIALLPALLVITWLGPDSFFPVSET